MAIVINGSGTVTGLAVGGLPDGTVDAGTVAADVATQSELDAAVFNPDAAVVFNESGADVDFRIESDTVTHALFVDGATGAVGLGTTAGNYYSSADNLVVYDSANHAGITIASGGTDKTGNIYFADGTSGVAEYEGYIEYNHNGNSMIFGTNHATQLSLTSNGRGLSQFTAKAWIRVDMSNMHSPDSHNVSSVTDIATGKARINFANNMANSSYNISTSANDGGLAAHSNITTSSFYLRASSYSGSDRDDDYTMGLVFGD